MGRVSDDGLIEIAYLDVDIPVDVGQRSEIAQMAIAANPQHQARRELTASLFEPLVEFLCASSHIGVRVARHLQITGLQKKLYALPRSKHFQIIASHSL